MPRVANYIVIRDTELTLAATNTDEYNFEAPDLIPSTGSPPNQDRPVLDFKLNPLADDARLQISLNNNLIFDETFSAGNIISLTEVLTHGQLDATDNQMFVANRATGEFIISDLRITYKTDV
jgi:hypothetical protein